MCSEKLQVLIGILGNYYKANDEHLFFCPYCDHRKRKLSINIESNVYKCWVCDAKGKSVYSLIRRFGTSAQKRQWQEINNEVDVSEFDNIFYAKEDVPPKARLRLPKEYIPLFNKDTPLLSRGPLRYLKSRGLYKDDILKWKIGYCSEGDYKNRIIVPSFDGSGYCNYFIARSYVNDWMKYKNPPESKNIIFNELIIDWNSDIVLVEGVFDAIKATNAIPLLGSTLNEKTELFKKIIQNNTPIFLALDADAEKKAANLVDLLLQYNIKVYKINTFGFNDVGEMTKEEFTKRKRNAREIDLNNFLLYRLNKIN